jgi:hypothetical protein
MKIKKNAHLAGIGWLASVGWLADWLAGQGQVSRSAFFLNSKIFNI